MRMQRSVDRVVKHLVSVYGAIIAGKKRTIIIQCNIINKFLYLHYYVILKPYRCCGGLFCEGCLQFGIELDEQVHSCCVSCNNCQTPGRSIKKQITARKIADAEVNGNAVLPPTPQATFIPLIQEEDYLKANPDSTEQAAGYFEILNKSEVYICVKLFISGDLFNEVPRPIFYPVGPNESLYAQFDKDVRQLNVIVLINNPHSIPMTRRVIVHK